MREMIAVDMNIDTDQIRKQIVIQEGHRDQTLIKQEEDTEKIDHKVYVYNLYLKFSLSK